MAERNDIEIAVLNQISHAIVHELNVSELLNNILNILRKEMGLIRGTITLKHDDTLVIEASNGLTDEEISRGKYMIGEGITGKVAQTGKPALVPDISQEPEFLGRTQARGKNEHVAFICVPIMHLDNIIGTLSIDCPGGDHEELKRDLRLLDTVANIMAEAVASCLKKYDERRQLLEENMRLREELGTTPRPANLIGNCNAMRAVYKMIGQVANSSATVLIRGESGTGKELVARAIQMSSGRRDKPFIAVNCAALPDNLIESELFGYEKGAFTGAVSRRIGRAEAADGGTLFLDEIGDLSQHVQVKLLRFIQERTFSRVGSNEEIKVDVRLLTATSRDLEKLMEEGKFREDLYYRLNVFPIHLPSLHKRPSDIILLADHFLEKYNRLHGKNIARISTPAINMLMAYHWPGNVRELENCIERAVLTAGDTVIHGYDLPPSLQTGEASGTAVIHPNIKADFQTLVNSFERELIVEALKANHGNAAAAARQLGLSERIIHYKIRNLGITPDWYRQRKNQK